MEQKTDEQGKIARGQPPTNIVTVITHVRVYENGERFTTQTANARKKTIPEIIEILEREITDDVAELFDEYPMTGSLLDDLARDGVITVHRQYGDNEGRITVQWFEHSFGSDYRRYPLEG